VGQDQLSMDPCECEGDIGQTRYQGKNKKILPRGDNRGYKAGGWVWFAKNTRGGC